MPGRWALSRKDPVEHGGSGARWRHRGRLGNGLKVRLDVLLDRVPRGPVFDLPQGRGIVDRGIVLQHRGTQEENELVTIVRLSPRTKDIAENRNGAEAAALFDVRILAESAEHDDFARLRGHI